MNHFTLCKTRITALSALVWTASLSAAVAGAPSTTVLTLWHSEEAALPTEAKPEPGAILREVSLDLGQGEHESFWVNVTSSRAVEQVAVSVSELRSGKGNTLPAVRVREQREYRLYDASHLGPLAAGQTGRVWFTLDAGNALPGTYEGTITFTAGAEPHTLPLRVKVWGVRLPPTPRVSLEGYSGAIGVVNSYPQMNEPARKAEIIALLRDLGSGGSNWLEIFINRATFLQDVKLRDSGVPLWTALQQSPDLFRGSRLPRLDFSCFDEWFEEATKAGLVRCAIHVGNFTASLLPSLEKLAGAPLPAGSDSLARYTVWIWGEFARYLKSRGYPEVWVKISDEMSPDDLEGWIAAADLARKAGMRPYTTWTGFLARQKGALRKANPHCDQWQVQLLSLHNFRSFVADPSLVDPDDEVWTYGGGSQSFKKDYLGYRQLGWYAGHYGVCGYGFWVYYWWTAGEQVVYPEGEQVIATPAWEGVKDGHDDAEYLSLLDAMVKQSQERVRRGVASAKERKALETALAQRARIMGTEAKCLLRLEPDVVRYGKAISYPWYRLTNQSTATLRQAKVQVLSLIADLQPFYQPSVVYGRVPLVAEGRPAAILTRNEPPAPAEQAAIQILLSHIERLSGVRLPVKPMDDLTTEEKEQNTLVQVGKPSNEWRLREYALDLGMTKDYPSAGNYVIGCTPSLYNPDVAVIVIAGADEAGTRRGVENFVRFLRWR